MALLSETFYLSTRRISVAYDVTKHARTFCSLYATQLMLVKILINSYFIFSFIWSHVTGHVFDSCTK